MFLCLGKHQRKKFPLRIGLCLQDFKPSIWTITASVSGNQAHQVLAKPGVLDIRTVIRALVLIRVQSSATFCSAHARGVSVHHARRFAGSDSAEAPQYVNSRALRRCWALHHHQALHRCRALHHRRAFHLHCR